MPNNLNISITAGGDPEPNPANCSPGDRISWTNNNRDPVDAFTLPACLSPQTSPAPIASGATTREYQVNAAAKGSYGYTYMIDGEIYSGTIDVT
jgi:hypothetical protein